MRFQMRTKPPGWKDVTTSPGNVTSPRKYGNASAQQPVVRPLRQGDPRTSGQCTRNTIGVTKSESCTAMTVEGVLTAPELNGRPGVVKAWDEEKGRYVVSLQGEKRLKNIKPVHCRADVPELSA